MQKNKNYLQLIETALKAVNIRNIRLKYKKLKLFRMSLASTPMLKNNKPTDSAMARCIPVVISRNEGSRHVD